jgi:hypothetical protein
MKAILEFDLPQEQEELDTAVKAIEWKRCLEEISETVVAWRCGKPEPVFPGRELEMEIVEMQPVLELIREKMDERGLRFD